MLFIDILNLLFILSLNDFSSHVIDSGVIKNYHAPHQDRVQYELHNFSELVICAAKSTSYSLGVTLSLSAI